MITFNRFLKWEKTTKDTIDFKKIYVDMADGDPIAGLALSQIVFWHLPDKDGHSKLRVERDGHYWIAKPRNDWWDECRLTPKRVDRALKILSDVGIISVETFHFAGIPTLHVRINEQTFMEEWEKHLGADILTDPDPIRMHPESNEDSTKSGGNSHFPKRVKTNLPSNSINDSAILKFPESEVGFLPNVNLDIPNSAISCTEINLQRPIQRPATIQQSVVEPTAVVDFENSKNGNNDDLESRIAKVVEILRPYKLAAKTIRDAARVSIEHAEYVSREFPHEEEADSQFWIGRSKGSTAGALRLRLENTDWQSSRDIAQQESDQQDAIEAEQRVRNEAQRATARAIEQQQAEAREFEAKVFVSRTMGEFARLTPKKQAQVLAQIKARNEFLVSRAPGGDMRRIQPESPLWISYVQAIGAVLQEWQQRQPELSGFEQRAAGESFAGELLDEENEALPQSPQAPAHPLAETEGFSTAGGLASPTIARLMAQRGHSAPSVATKDTAELDAEIRRAASVHYAKIHYNGDYGFADINQHRAEINKHRNEGFSDDEWAQVLAEVERMLNEAQRLAA